MTSCKHNQTPSISIQRPSHKKNKNHLPPQSAAITPATTTPNPALPSLNANASAPPVDSAGPLEVADADSVALAALSVEEAAALLPES